MLKKAVLIIGLIFISISSISQNSLNDYKYVVVPNNFDFLSEPNQYRLNQLTKSAFEKHGFIAFMDDENLPDDALSNACLILNADVIKEKSMFSSKLKVQLENCKGEIIYTSQIGQSRDKQRQIAYTVALRQAFNSFHAFNYAYKENPNILSYGNPKDESKDREVEKLKEEISQLKEEKEKLEVETRDITPEVTVASVAVINDSTKPETIKSDELKAKEIFNGFELLDASSKVIMTIYTSGVKDVFIVKGKDAIIYKKGENWIYSETNATNLLAQAIKIKF